MGLVLWMPCIKDLHNQGLVGTNPTGTCTYEVGKIGNCAKVTSTIDTGLSSDKWDYSTKSISFGGWFKFNKDEMQAAVLNKNTNTKQSFASFNLLGKDSYNGFALSLYTNNIYNPTADLTSLNIQAHMRSSTASWSCSFGTIEWDIWIHLFITWDFDSKTFTAYKNGAKINSYTIPNWGGDFTYRGAFNIAEKAIFGGNGPAAIMPFRVNDVRVYDYCLSIRELKFIASALVLHYPLNSLVNPNLVKNSYYCTNMHKGTVEVVPNVGYVDNTAYYGSPAYHVFREGQTTIAYSEFQFIFRANKCVPGKQYCISFWVKKCHSGGNWGNIILDGLRWFKTGDNTMYTTSITWNNRPSESLLNVWQYASFYFTFPIECTDYAYYYNTVGKDIDYYISKIKVEEGTVSTPWCDYGITNNIVYDCSGYQNNGTISGSLSCSEDSPRYKTSIISIDESSFSKILCSNLNLPNGQTTLSFWSKPTNKKEEDSSKIEITYSKNKYFTYINYPYFIHDGDYKYKWKNYWSDGNWHFVTCLFDGTNTKIYIDGNNISPSTGTDTSTAKTQLDNLTLLIRGNSLSDFRVYATALSEEDIKELYNTSCIINS